jgi:hypothetical protein
MLESAYLKARDKCGSSNEEVTNKEASLLSGSSSSFLTFGLLFGIISMSGKELTTILIGFR